MVSDKNSNWMMVISEECLKILSMTKTKLLNRDTSVQIRIPVMLLSRPLTNVRFLHCTLILMSIVLARPSLAGDPLLVLPDDQRIENVQSPAEYFGFAIGSRHLRHDQVHAYFQYLAEHCDRAVKIPYGKTHGGRPLSVLAISNSENIQQLDALRKKRPKLTSGKLEQVPADALLVMSLCYSVHGDEASAVNAAPLVAFHLCTSLSEEVVGWLNQGVCLVDPALNPDGVDRFANWANENRGRYPSPNSIAREHSQPWPGGRTNYYWFDLNRDWLPLAHPESQGRLKLFHQWKPNVVLDFHEMGGTSTFFFQPGIPARTNPLTPATNRELTKRMALEHAKAMDAANELYFTEEQYDDFYMGKGSTYPDLHGAVGILFEQGSTRGLRLTNDLTDRHFRDTVANQVRTSLSSLRGAFGLKAELLEFQRQFYKESLESGQGDPTTATVLTGSHSRVAAARDLLKRHAIRTHVPPQPVLIDGQSFESGQALVIPSAQSEIQFIRSMMDTAQSFQENLFYDVSTWHLPSAFDLDVHLHGSDLPELWLVDSEEVAEEAFCEDMECAGYAIRPEELWAPRVIASLMRIDADVRITTEPMRDREDGNDWPPGTFLILRQPNQARWQRILKLLAQNAAKEGMIAHPIASSLTASGPDLGSTTVRRLPRCNPLLVVGAGTIAYEAGAIWHFIDHKMGQASTLVDTLQLAEVNLQEYSCVILPSGSYAGLVDKHVTLLKEYVRSGGTLIGVGDAIGWIQQKEISVATPEKKSAQTADGHRDLSQVANMPFGDAGNAKALESIAGAFMMTHIDPTHPLAYGFPDADVPVFRDSEARFELPANPYQIVARYTDVIAGYVSDRNRQRLIPSAAVWVAPSGKGRCILMADNPVFRGYVRSSERFLTNAILLGPTVTIPAAPISGSASGVKSPGAPADHDH